MFSKLDKEFEVVGEFENIGSLLMVVSFFVKQIEDRFVEEDYFEVIESQCMREKCLEVVERVVVVVENRLKMKI